MLKEQIEQYIPKNEQEAADRLEMLRWLQQAPKVFTRQSTAAHFTASAWVTDPKRQRVLLVYHNLYDSWSWMGGHADGEENLLQVALREVQEESGVRSVRPLSAEILSLEVIPVNGHFKKGKYVSAHLHLNVTYLLEADDREALQSKADENSAVGWFPLEEAVQASTEPWFQSFIYPKLNQRLLDFADQ